MDETTIKLRVRYAETDQMGRAHHAHHLVWAEAGRTAWLRERGTSYAELERRGVYLPVSRVEVDYRRGVGFDQVVRVATWPEAVRSRRITFGYRITGGGDDDLVAELVTDLVCVDAERRVRRIPDDVLRTLAGDGTGDDPDRA